MSIYILQHSLISGKKLRRTLTLHFGADTMRNARLTRGQLAVCPSKAAIIPLAWQPLKCFKLRNRLCL